MKAINKEKLKEFIGSNKTDVVFTPLLNWLDLKGDEELRNELWISMASYNDILKKERAGITPDEEISRQKNKINKSLLNLIDLIPDKLPEDSIHEASANIIYETGTIQSHPQKMEEKKANNRNRIKLFYYLGFFLLGILVTTLYLSKPTLEKNGDIDNSKAINLRDSFGLKTLILDTKTENSRLDYLIPKIKGSPLFKVNYILDETTLPHDFNDLQKKQDLYIMHWHTYKTKAKKDSPKNEIMEIQNESENVLIALIDTIKAVNPNANFLIFSSLFNEKNQGYSDGLNNFEYKKGNRTHMMKLGFPYEKDWIICDTTSSIFQKVLEIGINTSFAKGERK